jgi:acyl-CoA synthetase (AMP-forming)/AMP-acid ligase II
VVPEVVERVLAAHPEVRECLVFGVPGLDPQRGESIVACVSLKSRLGPDDLKQYALGVLSAWQVPRDWWIVESLAADGRGKLSRAEWRRRYLEENGRRSAGTLRS